jgi:hypothetical protein
MSNTLTALGDRKGDLKNLLGSGAEAEAEKQFTDVFRIRKAAADSMATDTTAETLGFTFPYAGRVTKIGIVTDADATGHASNHATVTVSKRDAAGANKAALGTYTTDSDVAGQGTLAEFVEKDFDLTDANVAVVENGACTFEIAKGGSGVVVPISEIAVYVLRQ